MSIIVSNLTKQYGEQFAIKDLSFEVREGEIIGLLGPNGAGKTTTMKILAGYMPPSSGMATVYNLSIAGDAERVKQNIGYLPEHNPLYLEMYVREYLQFVARIHKLSNIRQRVEDVIELTGLGLEAHKPISALSKGYRQRVGLAQAIIHDPKVLILDEPTSGLDPNQLVQIRQLIKKLGKDKIVIFSSHIMQEVEALCDRVLILNRGVLVANNSIQSLVTEQKHTYAIDIEFVKPFDKQNLELTLNAKVTNQTDLRATVNSNSDIREQLFDYAVSTDNKILGLHLKSTDIQEVFQSLTSKKEENA